MDLRQLRYFIAIVEQGSFSRAAETLSIAQPALSLHVRNMEAELGTALLFRTPQGVIATDAGKVLLHHARIVIGQISIAQEEIKNQQTEPRGEVSLGLPGTISQILSVPLIIELRKRFPKVKLRIAEAMSGFVLDWMRNDQVDLAVVYVPVSEKSVTSSPVLTEELWLLGPPGQSLDASSDRANFDMIAQLPLILPSTNHGLRILLEKEARARSLEPEYGDRDGFVRQHQGAGRTRIGLLGLAVQCDRSGSRARAHLRSAHRRTSDHTLGIHRPSDRKADERCRNSH